MFSYLKGILVEINNDNIILEVNNIGYEVKASRNTIDALPELSCPVKILTHFVVREDGHFIYGFLTNQEQELFKSIIKISGVGPKLALGILSGASPKNLLDIIINKDYTRLTKLPGVGKKTAERIVVELQDKFKKLLVEKFDEFSDITITSKSSNAQQNAVSALVSLGYKSDQAEKTVAKVYQDDEKEDTIIRKALQMLAGN